MGSDKARRSYDATRKYRSVVEQQGRVTLEADANEAEEIRSEESRAVLGHIVGPSGSPDDGFRISVPAVGSSEPFNFAIGAGSMYVGGERIVNDDPALSYIGQRATEWADYPNGAPADYPTATENFTEAVYLDLAEQEVGAVEDEALREVALGGPDTTARTRFLQRVMRMPVNPGTCESAFAEVAAKAAAEGWTFDPETMRLHARTRLRVDYTPPPDTVDPCQPIATSGFLGPDNQLIRLKLTGDNHLLWGWDNASFLYRIKVTSATTVQLRGIPVDAFHQPRVGQWIEVLGTAVDFGDGAGVAADVGVIRKVVGYDATSRTVKLSTSLPPSVVGNPGGTVSRLFMRSWESRQVLPADDTTPVELVDAVGSGTGARVYLQGDPTSGAYWLIGVRPTVSQEVLPARLKTFQPPDGPRRWIAPLAVIAWSDDLATADVTDCRPHFDPLTAMCCIKVRPGGDIRAAIKKVRKAGGGCIVLCPGIHHVVGKLSLDDLSGVQLTGRGSSTVLHLDLDADQQGGLVIRNGRHVTVESMFVVGTEVPALIAVEEAQEEQRSRHVTLRDLTMVNVGARAQATEHSAGIRISNADGVSINRCRIIANVGVIALWGRELPWQIKPSDRLPAYGDGVSHLLMRDSEISYGVAGILATKCERWDLQRCKIQPHFIARLEGAWKELFEKQGKPLFDSGELTEAGATFSHTFEQLGTFYYHGIVGAGAQGVVAVVPDGPSTASVSVTEAGAFDRSVVRVGVGGVVTWTNPTDNPYRVTSTDNRLSPSSGLLRRAYAAFLATVDSVFSTPAPLGAGTAIIADQWYHCTMRQCLLRGNQALQVWWSVGSSVRDSRIVAERRGLHAFWLHGSQWHDNHIDVEDGAAMSFVGSYRSTLCNNTTRGIQGCRKLSLVETAPEYLLYPRALLIAGYRLADSEHLQKVVLRIMLTELVSLAGLGQIIDKVAQLYEAMASGSPRLLAQLADELHGSLQSFRDAPENVPDWIAAGALLPVAALTVEGNTMASSADTLFVERFFALGGMRIVGNTLSSANAQAIRVNAWAMSALTSQVSMLLQGLMAGIDESQPPEPIATPTAPDPAYQPAVDQLFATLNELTAELFAKVVAWKPQLLPLLVTDYRVAGNTLRSSNTAVETNLFGVVVTGNHITLARSTEYDDELEDVVEALETGERPDLAALALSGDVASFEGVAYHPAGSGSVTVGLALDGPTTPLRGNIRYRSSAHSDGHADNIYINRRTIAADVAAQLTQLDTAIAAEEVALARKHAARLAIMVEGAVGSYGIWTKGEGVSISHNQIDALGGLKQLSDRRGGILMQGDEQLAVLALLFDMIALVFGGRSGFEVTPSQPENVVERNEIHGGIGHGVHVLDTPLFTGKAHVAFVRPLVGVSIRQNEIGGMGGSGVAVGPEACVINLDVEGNQISLCGNAASLAQYTDSKGGISIAGAGRVRLSGNRVSRCGGDAGGTGIDLRWIYMADLHDNHVVANGAPVSLNTGSGLYPNGISLFAVRGEVRIVDNELLANETGGLFWANYPASDVLPTPVWFSKLVAAVDAQLAVAGSQLGNRANAVIANNTFRSKGLTNEELTLSCFRIERLGSVALLLSGNSCAGHGDGPLAFANLFSSGVIVGNHFRLDGGVSLSVDEMGAGTIANNLSIGGEMVVSNAEGVVHGLNAPPLPYSNPIPENGG